MRPSLFVVLAIAATACTAYDPSLPETPFFCGTTDPKCPDGYTCMPAPGGKSVCTTGTMPPPSGSCTMPFSGVLATWSLGSETGSQTSTAAASSAPGVTAGAISRAAALMPATGAGSINASNWPSSAQLDPTKYFTISVAPPAGCTLDVTAMAIDAKASGTGPASASVATSQGAFGSPVAVSTSAPGSVSVSATGATGMLEIRIFGFGATATTGTLRIQNDLTVTGSLQ